MMRLACALGVAVGFVSASAALSATPDPYGEAAKPAAIASSSGGCVPRIYGGPAAGDTSPRSNDTTEFGVELRSGEVFANNDDTTFLNPAPAEPCPPQRVHRKETALAPPYPAPSVAPSYDPAPSVAPSYYPSPYVAPPYYASPYFASPYAALPYVASPYYASPYFVSPYYASPYYASPYYASPYYASPYFASPYVASPYVASPYVASPYYGARPAVPRYRRW